MQRKRLVAREPDERDRRANVIVATDAGHALFARVTGDVIRAELAQHAMLSDEERETLRVLLRKIAFPGA